MVYVKSDGFSSALLELPRAYESKYICADDCFGCIMTLTEMAAVSNVSHHRMSATSLASVGHIQEVSSSEGSIVMTS